MAPHTDPLQPTSNPLKILVVDSTVNNYTQLVNSTNSDVKVVLYDSKTTTMDGLLAKIKDALGGKQADSIAFAMEGQDNYIKVASDSTVTQDTINTNSIQSFFHDLGSLIKEGGRLDLLTCNLTQYSTQLVDTIDNLLDSDGHAVSVAASDDVTGNSFVGADWTLERGNVDALQYFNSNISNWDGYLATFIVTNTNDSGAGSLRTALTNANSTVGADTITFNIAGAGTKTINLLSSLSITDSVNINATSQPGYAGNPLIELNGNNGFTTRAFDISSPSGTTVTISGFSIGGFGGDAIFSNSVVRTVNITDNYIGLTAAGVARPNGISGISLAGGTIDISDNVISGNLGMGVYIYNNAASITIADNLIGTNVAGTAALGEYQGFAGVRIRTGNADNNLVISGNTISGNGNGIVFESTQTQNFLVTGNRIGMSSTGSTVIGNWGSGIIFGSPNSPITEFPDGTTGVISNNTIVGHGDYGIWFTEDGLDSLVELTQNKIFSNGSLGIEMGAAGPNANDGLDADTGNNNNQNIANLVISTPNSGGTYGVGGTLNSAANHTYRIEFFGNGNNDGFGYGEGQNYLGFVNVTTNGSGFVNIPTQTFNSSLGVWVSATVTDITAAQHFTSEFSRSVNINPNVLFISDGVFSEPATGTVNGTILLTLSSAATTAITVNLTALNGTAVAADYALLTNSVTFAVGEILKLISVQIKADSLNEALENFTVTATTGAAGITINGGSATVSIIDNFNSGVISPFALRYSAIAKGDMTAIGNVNMAPYDDTQAANLANINNVVPQVYVDADSNTNTFNSSSAVLSVGSGSSILFAGLYWSGYQDGDHTQGALPNVDSTAIGEVLFKTPTGTYVTVNASTLRIDYHSIFGGSAYSAFADVTSLVSGATGGSGTYFVGNIQTTPGYSVVGTTGNWSLLVVYGNSAQPTRSFSVFDGLAFAGGLGPVSIPIAGFKTPTVGSIDADLIISAQDGEGAVDSVRINSTSSVTGTVVSDASAPDGDILNSRITFHGVDVTNRNPNAINTYGFDLRTVDVSSYLTNGQTSTNFFVDPGADNLYMNLLAFSTTLYSADLTVTGTATDVNGGSLQAGDVVQYAFTVTNVGQDNAIQSILRDVMPNFTTYVAGSLVVVSGANTGAKTDATGDDTAFFDVANNRVVFNLGTGATTTVGGSLAPGATTVIRFRVTVDADAPHLGVIQDTATVNYKTQDINAALVDSGSVSITPNNIPDISINNVTVTEGDAGTAVATFTITLSNASTQNITVNYATANSTATTADGDYTAIGSTLLTFTAGQTSKTITVNINGDNFFESSETFNVVLTTPVNATIADGTGVVTITNDDAAPALIITPVDSVTAEAGNTGTFTVKLSSAPRSTVTINFTSSDAGEGTPGGSVTFDSTNWDTPQTITVTGVNDAIVDGTIAYNINLATTSIDAAYSGLTGSVAMTNLDNDVANISISDVTVTEGDSGTTTATFTVTLSNASTSAVTVNYATSNVTATTADADYVAIGSTVLTFAAGQTTRTITVNVNGDNFFETNETFNVLLSSAAGGTITDATGVGTIANDDAAPSIIITPIDNTTSEAGATGSFSVSLASAPRANVTVSFTSTNTSEGTPAVTSITFTSANWDVPQTVTINGVNDNIVDGTVGYSINVTTASTDTGYNSLTVASQAFTNADNDVANITINDVTITEGNSGTATATFTVTLSNSSTSNVTVNYSTSDSSATTADADYVAVGSTLLTFTAGQTSKTITVTINGDNFFEGNEAFSVLLADAVGGTITDGTGIGTITNDDAAPSLIITPVDSVTSEGGNTGNFTVRLSSAPRADVTVTFGSSDTTEGAAGSSITFTSANWNTPQTVTINGVDDIIVDGTIAYNISANSASSDTDYNGLTGSVAFTNLDNDVANISINDVTITEGNSGTVTATFTVSLSNASTSTVTVNYATANDTATTADADYVAIGATPLTFTAGQTTKTITVTINGDNFFEGNEAFNVLLSGAVGGTITDGLGIGTITNDDAAPTVVITPVDTTTTEAGGTGSFTVSLSSAPRANVTVNFVSTDTSEGVPAVTSITFNSTNWNTPQTVTINGVDDAIVDGTIAYNITMTTTSTDANFNNLAVTPLGFTNADNDTANITINDVTLTEGSSGTKNFTFTVNLSNASTSTVSVSYQTNDGTATTADGDYVAIPLSLLTFTAGQTSKTITVVVNGDNYNESTENFTVTLSSAVNGTITDASGTGTITNDDAAPSIIVTPVDSTTSESGATGNFNVRLSSAPRSPVTITLSSTNTAEGIPNTVTLTFNDTNWNVNQNVVITGQDDAPANVVDGSVAYTITGTVASSDANFNALAFTPVNMTNADNDSANFVISNATVSEGTGGSTIMTFTVSLSTPVGGTVTVDYHTVDGTASALVGEFDYSMIPNATLQFLAGETSKNISVTITPDGFLENDETFSVVLTNATGGATIGVDTGIGTIINDDNTVPAVYIVPSAGGDTTTSESGDTASFDVTLSSAPHDFTTVTITTSDSTEGVSNIITLIFHEDNWNIPQTIVITGQDDNIVDGNISYTIETSTSSADPTFNGLLNSSTPLTNLDNDVANITINDVSVVEGNNGTTTMLFTVSLSNASTSNITVDYNTANGTATTGDNDYNASPLNTLTFLAGQTTQTISVTVNGDNYFEGNETFAINLSNAVGGAITDGSGTGTIVNDDATGPGGPGALIIVPGGDGSTVTTTEAGGTGTFTVALTSAPRSPVTVTFTTTDPTEGTVITAPIVFDETNWNIPQTVTVQGADDATVDGPIAYLVTGTVSSSDPIYNGQVTTPVNFQNTDNDIASINIDNVTVTESNSGTTNMTFTVTLSNVSTSTITVDYNTLNGSATTADGDYTNIPLTTLQFLAGETTKTITVAITGDNFYEGDESLSVILSNASGGTIVSGTGIGTIFNDDAAPSVNIVPSAGGGGDTTTTEGGDTSTFDITLTSAPRSPVTVTITTSDPTEGTPNVTTLTFDSTNWDIPQTITITGQDDNIVDGNITYTIDTTSSSADTNFNGLLDSSTALTNLDNDVANITISDVTVVEGNSGTTTMLFTVSLSNASTSTITVDYNTTNGTATMGDNDYNGVSLNTLTFLAGQTTKTIAILVNGDNYFEGNETFTVNLSNAVGGTITDGSGLGTITNDDATGPGGPGAVIIVPGGTGSTVTTSEDGTTGTFTVSLTSAPRSPVTITFTSTDPTEGTVITTTVVFDDTNWDTPQTVTVQGLEDGVVDGTIPYQVTGTVTSADPDFNGQITTPVNFENTDNDIANITINNVTVTESNSGTTSMTFTVTLSNASTSTVSVDYQTLDGTATTADGDYIGIPLTTLQFLAGETTKQITVTIQGDNFLEGNENLSVVLTNAVGGTILTDAGQGTISNDDATGGVIIVPPPVDATTGEDGSTGSFTVTLSSAPRDTVTLTFTSTDPTEGVPSVTTITFDSTNWNVAQTILVNGIDDNIVDGDIVYSILTQLSSNDPNFNDVSFPALNFTNVDNDVAGLSVSDMVVVENDNGTTTGTFTINLSNPSLTTVTVDYSLLDGTGTLVDSDYQPLAPGSLIFAPGENTKTVTVIINGDYYYESNETVILKLNNAVNGVLVDDTGVGSIINDDATPQIIITPIDTVTNPDNPTGSIMITVPSKPREPITVYLESTNPSEGTPDQPFIVIDETNWQNPIIVTITGNGNSSPTGGPTGFSIIATPVSNDPFFGALPPTETTFVNVRPSDPVAPVDPGPTIVATPPRDHTIIQEMTGNDHDNGKVISFDTLRAGYSGMYGLDSLKNRFDFEGLDSNTYEFYGIRNLSSLENGYLFDSASKLAKENENSMIAPLWGIDGTEGRLFAFKEPNNLMGSYISYGDLYYDDPNQGAIKLGGHISSFAIDRDNIAYMVINGDVGGIKGPVLAKVDLNTLSKDSNNIQIVGTINGKAITGIAFDKASGYLYGIERQNGADVLKIYNKENGYSIEIGALKDKNNVNFRAEDLKFDEDGELYATGPNEKLFFINRSSGKATPVEGQAHEANPSALAWDNSQKMFMVVGDDSVSYYQHKVFNHEAKIDAKALGISSIDGLNFIDTSKN
jgi:hypothetical protein